MSAAVLPFTPKGRRAQCAAVIEGHLREARQDERDLINRLRAVRAEITDLEAGLIGLGITTTPAAEPEKGGDA